MKAIVCKAFGPIETLTFADFPLPPVAPTQVRLAVRAASLGFMDILMAQGKYQLRPPLPYVPGACGAGDVIEVGNAVRAVRPGDRVSFLNYYGAFAEETVTEEHALVLLPGHMSYEQAATYRLTYSPAYFALVERAHLKAGETLLVTGAAGGVGMAATRLAKVLGARVIAAVGSEAKMAAVRANGADEVIDYARESLRDRVKHLTGGKGADVILDVVGGDIFDQCVRCINSLGRIIVMGFTSGRIPTLAMNLPLLKNCSIIGVFYGGWGMGRNHEAVGRLNDTLLALASEGKLPAHVSQRYPLAETVAAMHALLGRGVVGKLVLLPR